jgi:glucose-1-phosphate cytidylyltransferase
LKVVILAGGLGTRLAEETTIKPKPMVEIGDRPILWHIMKHYAHYNFKEFFIALGYKGEVIKRYFLDSYHMSGDMTVDFSNHSVEIHNKVHEDWIVHLMDTGLDSNTGGRVRRLRRWLEAATFMLTYGDGVSNVDLRALLEFHQAQGRIATITAVRPPARFGALVIQEDLVNNFIEKPQAGEGWINGGFLVCEPAIFEYIHHDDNTLEVDVLPRLAAERQLAAYQHGDFWQGMDTLRDKRQLEGFWQSQKAPWKVWK